MVLSAVSVSSVVSFVGFVGTVVSSISLRIVRQKELLPPFSYVNAANQLLVSDQPDAWMPGNKTEKTVVNNACPRPLAYGRRLWAWTRWPLSRRGGMMAPLVLCWRLPLLLCAVQVRTTTGTQESVSPPSSSLPSSQSALNLKEQEEREQAEETFYRTLLGTSLETSLSSSCRLEPT